MIAGIGGGRAVVDWKVVKMLYLVWGGLHDSVLLSKPIKQHFLSSVHFVYKVVFHLKK